MKKLPKQLIMLIGVFILWTPAIFESLLFGYFGKFSEILMFGGVGLLLTLALPYLYGAFVLPIIKLFKNKKND